MIGHIIGHQFVPVKGHVASNGPDMLSYGVSALVKSVTQDLVTDLLAVYPAENVYSIIAMATLKVIKPSITGKRMATHYNRTFVCKDYPGVSLSQNSIEKLLQLVGQDGARRKQFNCGDHHIAIDGTLKQDTSVVNDLSAFSYKARLKGCREISVLYAYDTELMEPICAEIFPDNSIDASSYSAFIRDNDIQRGIIVADKSFPPSMIRDELAKRPDLHFLTPIKRNDVKISDNDMLSYEGVLEGIEGHILYKQKQIKGGRFLYAFNRRRSGIPCKCRAKKFDSVKYEKKSQVFGVIVLESDQDLKPVTAYLSYDDRWILELVFNRYKSDECLDRTGVQGNFSVIGAEFVNFISTVATCRIIRKAQRVIRPFNLRPSDANLRVVPCKTALIVCVVEVVALIAELCGIT